ncbi:hypothetical protein D3C76_1039980 [compost metagenome]
MYHAASIRAVYINLMLDVLVDPYHVHRLQTVDVRPQAVDPVLGKEDDVVADDRCRPPGDTADAIMDQEPLVIVNRLACQCLDRGPGEDDEHILEPDDGCDRLLLPEVEVDRVRYREVPRVLKVRDVHLERVDIISS